MSHFEKTHRLPLLCGLVTLTAVTFGQVLPIYAYVPGNRWTDTAAGPAGLEGVPITLTWSLVRDGTPIPNKGNSNLIAFLDDLFNYTDGGTNFSQRPWFSLFQQSFDRWQALSGVKFDYEVNDDGVFLIGATGRIGARGDIRIGGQNIDGPGGTYLAYTYLPNIGDIVIDTTETNLFSNGTNNFRYFRNVLMHELGHAIGLGHVVSSTDQLLMEPHIDVSFDGPQLDDIRGAQAYYGDRIESTNSGQGNATAALAYNLGTLSSANNLSVGSDAVGGQFVNPTESDFVSITNTRDVDFYSFTVDASSKLSAALTPLGGTLSQAPQNGTESTVNASAQNDLSLTILSSNGTTILASSNTAGAGQPETVSDVSLSVGQYFVRVTGASDSVQLYQLQLWATTNPLLGDYNQNGVVDATDYAIWRKSLGRTGTNLAADGDGNGQVDSDDYTIWRNDFEITQGSVTGLGHSATVPEPACDICFLMLLVVQIRVRSSRSSTSKR